MRRLIALAVFLTVGVATRMTAQTPGDWDGACNYQNMPYMGMYTDGVSPWWGGYFDQPHTGTCRTMSGMYFDMWMLPAQPGDVFNMTFGGASNTYCALADHNGGSSAYVDQYMMMPGMGSMGGMYTAGWTNFTVPPSFNHGYMEVWVAKNTSQAHYLVQAVKISSQAGAACTPRRALSGLGRLAEGHRRNGTRKRRVPDGGHRVPVVFQLDERRDGREGAGCLQRQRPSLGFCWRADERRGHVAGDGHSNRNGQGISKSARSGFRPDTGHERL
jgi:hypothetical protein